jgi:aminopeptidase
MIDSRISKLAEVLVRYSMNVQPEQQVVVAGGAEASPLLLAACREVLAAGGFVVPMVGLQGVEEIILKHGNDQQVSYISPVQRFPVEQADARLQVLAETNTRALNGVDPARQQLAQLARRELMQTMLERAARDELRWCLTLYPTEAYAQDADMSLGDYADFVFNAGLLDQDDPVAAWREASAEQQRLIEWLKGKREVHVTGPDTDLRVTVAGREWINADGTHNFPDGEIFTGPVEDSVEGTIRFSYPSMVQGREVEDIRLWFEGGQIVKATAAKNQEFLDKMLTADEGAKRLGEFAIGTNFGITKFTKNILFDEKIGGTVHMAIGAGYPETGSRNQSAVHWDMICDLRQGGQVSVDGQVFLQDGKIVV